MSLSTQIPPDSPIYPTHLQCAVSPSTLPTDLSVHPTPSSLPNRHNQHGGIADIDIPNPIESMAPSLLKLYKVAYELPSIVPLATNEDEIATFSPFHDILLCMKLIYDLSANNPHEGCDPDMDNTLLTKMLDNFCSNGCRCEDTRDIIRCGPWGIEGLCFTLHQFITLCNLKLDYIDIRLHNLGVAIGL